MKLAGGRAGVAAGLLIVEWQSSSVSQAVAASQGCVFGHTENPSSAKHSGWFG